MRISDFELPILCWLDRNGAGTTHEIEIPNATRDDVYFACDSLRINGFLNARPLESMDDDRCLAVTGLTDRGRKRVQDAFKDARKLRIDERHFIVRSILFQHPGPLDHGLAYQIDTSLTVAFNAKEKTYRDEIAAILKSRQFNREDLARLVEFLRLMHGEFIPQEYRTYIDHPDKWVSQ